MLKFCIIYYDAFISVLNIIYEDNSDIISVLFKQVDSCNYYPYLTGKSTKNIGREIFKGPKGWSCTHLMKINETCVSGSLWCLWKIFPREVKLHAQEKPRASNRAWAFWSLLKFAGDCMQCLLCFGGEVFSWYWNVRVSFDIRLSQLEQAVHHSALASLWVTKLLSRY